jgi:phosphoglycolate phosphatase
MQNEFKLLVFDWDGTLMDSEARIVACMQAAAADLGLTVPHDESVRNIIGLGLREAVTALIPGADDALIQRVADQYRSHFLERNQTPSQLFPGAAEVLWALHGQGYLLAVATGKGRHGLDRVLAETGCERVFHATRCADETFSKPHPEMLLQLMDELGVEAAETLMIGDTEYDLQMASNARARSLAVSYGVHPRERLLQHGPVGCLDDIRDLTHWLAQRSVPVRTLEEQTA